jgi:hypothetical protein
MEVAPKGGRGVVLAEEVWRGFSKLSSKRGMLWDVLSIPR